MLLGVTDMTNELLTLRQQNTDKDAEIDQLEKELGSVRLELETEQRVSDERAQEIERLLEEGEDTLAVHMEVRKSTENTLGDFGWLWRKSALDRGIQKRQLPYFLSKERCFYV